MNDAYPNQLQSILNSLSAHSSRTTNHTMHQTRHKRDASLIQVQIDGNTG